MTTCHSFMGHTYSVTYIVVVVQLLSCVWLLATLWTGACQAFPYMDRYSSRYRYHRWPSGKEFTCQWTRSRFVPWVGKIPWSRKWQLTPEYLPGKFHGQRNLTGYSPWGHKYCTQLSTHVHMHVYVYICHIFFIYSSLDGCQVASMSWVL